MFGARISRAASQKDYLLALLFVGASAVVRLGIERLVPGTAYYVVMLPAVVLAGVFCGTGPAILAASAGGAAVTGLFLRHGLVGSVVKIVELDMLVYVPACAAVIWSITELRRYAAEAIAARTELQETLDARDMLVREPGLQII